MGSVRLCAPCRSLLVRGQATIRRLHHSNVQAASLRAAKGLQWYTVAVTAISKDATSSGQRPWQPRPSRKVVCQATGSTAGDTPQVVQPAQTVADELATLKQYIETCDKQIKAVEDMCTQDSCNVLKHPLYLQLQERMLLLQRQQDYWLRQQGALEKEKGAPELFSNVVLYTPDGDAGSYMRRTFKQTSRAQLQARLAVRGLDTVTVVSAMPAALLQFPCPGQQDIDEVDLCDNTQLAAVVDLPGTPISEVSGCDTHGGDEVHLQQWAVTYLQMQKCEGIKPFCHTHIVFKEGVVEKRIEIHGMASSTSLVVLVECRAQINRESVDWLVAKSCRYRELVSQGAPNTKDLVDWRTGQLKPVQLVLMADGWVSDVAEKAYCKQRMQEMGILPVLPQATVSGAGDSCNRWPPMPEDLAAAACRR